MYSATWDATTQHAIRKAERGNTTVRFDWHDKPGEIPRLLFDTDEPRGSLAEILDSPTHVVYPSGLVLPLWRVNWFWSFPRATLLGNAEQGLRLCMREHIATATVHAYARDQVVGTCVVGPGRDYALIQARSFPWWCGV